MGVRTLYRWLHAYEVNGLPGLENRPRTQSSTDGVLEPVLISFLIDEKERDPAASIPQLLRLAVVAGLLRSTQDVDRVTVWRALKRRGVDTKRRAKGKEQRRFAKAHRFQMVMSDGKHFRAGPNRVKRVALFFIDDATRCVPVVVVGPTETEALFLRGLYRLLRLYGRMDSLYVDNGSGFTSLDTRSVLANLGIAHILGLKGYPEGRGKIERFNRTVEGDLLRHLDAPDVDPECLALELRIAHYLREDYNMRPHCSLAKGETPRSRFETDERALQLYPSEEELRWKFFVSEQRKVTKDHVISFQSRKYEVPLGLAGERITIQRSVFAPQPLELWHVDRWIRLHEVNPVANAAAPRGRPLPVKSETPASTEGAALSAAQASYGSVTQPDGGFVIPEEEEE